MLERLLNGAGRRVCAEEYGGWGGMRDVKDVQERKKDLHKVGGAKGEAQRRGQSKWQEDHRQAGRERRARMNRRYE